MVATLLEGISCLETTRDSDVLKLGLQWLSQWGYSHQSEVGDTGLSAPAEQKFPLTGFLELLAMPNQHLSFPNRKGKKEFMLQAVFCLLAPLQLFLHRSFGTATNLVECTIYNNHYPLSSVCDEWFYGMEFDSRICSSNWPFQLSQIAKSGSELKNVSEINTSTEERKPC